MAASTGAVISGASSLIGAGASLLGGSNGSAAAESANKDAQYNASMDRLALMIGFANAYNDFQGNTQNALAQLNEGKNFAYDYGNLAQGVLSGLNDTWDRAYGQGSNALNNALAEWDSKYNQVRADESPYMALGQQGVAGYSGLLTDPSSITSNPGYQFQLSQGLQGLDRSAASKGLLLSGAQQQAVNNYAQDYASTSYDKALSRYLNAANLGQTATTQVNNAGMTTAAGKGNAYNALAQLAASTAAGKSSVGQASANAYMNTGSTLAGLSRSGAGEYDNLSSLIQQLWSNTANNLVKTDSGSSEASASTASAEASSENNALSGVANSLNSGVKNYLTASGYGTNSNPFTNGTRNVSGWNY